MTNPIWRRWLKRISSQRAGARRRPAAGERPSLERLEDRTVPTVGVGSSFTALDFNQSGGYVPPDTVGAAGPSSYVETVNQTVGLYNKSGGPAVATSSLNTFWFSTGGLAHADSGSGLSDPIVVYDDQIGRFIVGDQDVDFNTHVSRFDLAVSTSSNPTTLSASDWNFYQINTTESGYDADYPGNFGYNNGAFVFTLNMFGANDHTQVVSVSNSALAGGTPLTKGTNLFQNDLNDFDVRPTVMHDSSSPNDPMWLVTEHGDGQSIDVIKMTNVLSSSPPTFTYTNLAVTPYSPVVNPKNPNGTVITNNIDSRIIKAAEWGNVLVASQSVGVSSTEDDAQWYAIDVSSGTPVLQQQGRVRGGNNTYITYPSVDINSSGQIGMTYMKSGTDSSTDYMSMYVTGRNSSDAAGTMEGAVEVPAGTGQANYKDFASGGRAGDLSGINVDPSDGSFWAANEFANTEATANWGTAVANFTVGTPLPSADMAVTVSAGSPSPVDVTNGPQQVTYTITVTNNDPSNTAQNVVLSNTLPAGSSLVSLAQTAGPDTDFAISGSTATAATVGARHTDTFVLTVTAPASLASGAFNDTASVSANNPDPNIGNNSATGTDTVVNTNTNANADLSAAVSGPSSVSEGGTATYTITVTNAGPAVANAATLTDTLGPNLTYKSATLNGVAATPTVSNGVVTFSLGNVASGATVKATVTAQATEDGSTSDAASVTSGSPDPNSANNSGSASTSVSEPAIPVISKTISARAGTPTNFQVTFTHASGVEPASNFVASINWGDGSKPSTGTITQQSNGSYLVTASHTYSRRAYYTVKVTVTETTQAADKADVDPGTLPPGQRDIVNVADVGRSGGRGVTSGSPAPSAPSAGSTPDLLSELIAAYSELADQVFTLGVQDLEVILALARQRSLLSGGDSGA